METDSQEGLAVLEFCMERDHGCISETSVHFNETTRLYIPESCPLEVCSLDMYYILIMFKFI
jgi:hypothetical protein